MKTIFNVKVADGDFDSSPFSYKIWSRINIVSIKTLLMLSLLIAFCAVNSQAAGVVTNTNDSGAGSLRAAVVGGGAVTFNIPANSAGCTGTACTITLASTLTLPGTTAINATTPANNTITIAGNGTFTLLTMTAGGSTFSIDGVTISGGGAANGGGLNYAAGGSTLTINRTTFTNNNATGSGGLGGGLFRGNNGGTVTITNSTFNNNHADGSNARGGGLYVAGGAVDITNSTFSGNTNNGNNGNGGGIYVTNAGAVVTLNYVTVTLNTSTGNGNNGGGGIFNQGSSVTVRNTIIAGNTTTGTGPDINGTFTSGGYNLVQNSAGGTGFTNGVNNDQVGVSPMLGPLANNGGPTRTHALMTGSPAIDKASAFGGVTTDQRGRPRPYDDPLIANAGGANANGADIGAYEARIVSAAPVFIRGRVLTGPGRAIRNATVTLTAPNGDVRYARTNPFGNYEFTEVSVGETYILAVEAKKYGFLPQVLFVVEDMEEVNFVAP